MTPNILTPSKSPFPRGAKVVAPLLLLFWSLCAVAVAWFTNPTVKQGGSSTFAYTAHLAPAGASTWDVVNPSGTVVATDAVPNGWSESFDGTNFTVGAPLSATIGSGYKVRYHVGAGTNSPTGGGGGPGFGPIAPAQPAAPYVYYNFSAVFDVIVADPPAAPTGLSATPGNAQVALTWNASQNATSYTVRWGTTSGAYPNSHTGVSGTSYTVTGLTNGTTYYFVVAGVNNGGTGPNSSEASATPIAPPGSAPTGLAASPGNAQVALTWNSLSGAASYVVRWGTSVGNYPNSHSGISGTSYTVTGLTNGTTYHFVVAGANAGGTGPNSSDVGATPVAPPAAPTGVSTLASDGAVTVSWSASTGATSYTLKRGTSSGGPFSSVQAGITGTQFSDGTVVNFMTYYYVVSASNAGGESANSSPAVAATPHGPPDPPATVGVTPYCAANWVYWSTSAHADGYKLYRSTERNGTYSQVVAGLTATHYCDQGLTNDTTYYYYVVATNADGDGDHSSIASGTPADPLAHFSLTKVEETGNVVATYHVVHAAPKVNSDFPIYNEGSVQYYANSTAVFYLCTDSSKMGVVSGLGDTRTFANFGGSGVNLSGEKVTSDSQDAYVTQAAAGESDVYLVSQVDTYTGYYDYPGHWVQTSHDTYYIVNQRNFYNVLRVDADFVSVDSRKTYGQPNNDGELPGDPNADLRSVDFNGWTYKGGLFVGAAPPSMGDLSGTARIQGYLRNPPTLVNPKWCDLSLYYLSAPATMTAYPTIDCRFPAANDPNRDTTKANTTWASAWNLSTSTLKSTFAFGSSVPDGSRINLQFPGYDAKFLLALQDEASVVSSGAAFWRYFATPEWATATGQISTAVAQPRVWIMDLLFTDYPY